MQELTVDAWYCWVGVSVAGLAVLGVVLGLPTAAAPDAVAVVETVDAVASSPHEATARMRPNAGWIRLGPNRVALRTGGRTDHATFAYGPVTPTWDSPRLSRVLDGRPPSRTFQSPAAFRDTVRRVRDRTPTWREAPSTVNVRRVTWEGVDVTLVGA